MPEQNLFHEFTLDELRAIFFADPTKLSGVAHDIDSAIETREEIRNYLLDIAETMAESD